MDPRRSSKKRLFPSARRKKRTGQSLIEWREKRKSKRRCLEETSVDESAEIPFASNDISQISKDIVLTGRRIIDIAYFFKRLREINHHGPFNCSLSNMSIISEMKKGLRTGLELKCEMCFFTDIIWSEDPKSDKMPVNTAAVSGIMSIGGGFSNLEDVLSSINIPCMNSHTFQKEHERISAAWEETSANEMRKAAMEEKRLAIEAGEIGSDGIPLLTVVADGCWAKRSYRTNYSSLSGAAAIVGFRTKKVLHLGVRNKYCSVCCRANKLKIPPNKHRCCKNWSGSSSGMEADIIKEGFLNSISMYGVKYSKLIADGDSNVYKMILDSRPYDELQVEKIECHNHLYRNFCNKLKDVVKDRKSGPISHRRMLGKNILRMRKAVTTATAFYSKHTTKDKPFELQKYMLNVPYHTFGRHNQCFEPFCKKEDRKEKDMVDDLMSSGLLFKVMALMQNLAEHSKSLLFAANNNCVEQFNSIVAKFIGGKRVNYCLRNSYQARCNGAVISHNSRFLMSSVHKNMYHTSPGNCVKSVEQKRQRQRQKRREKPHSLRHCRKTLFLDKACNESYGPSAQKPDLSEQEFLRKRQQLLASLQLSDEEAVVIERATTQQKNSPLWREERRKRLTASDFGVVCCRKDTTSCESTIKNKLYSHFRSAAMKYGQDHEEIAIRALEESSNVKIRRCGLFINPKFSYLAASPDGLIDDDGIVEIKCPASCKELTPDEAIRTKKFPFWKLGKDGETFVNKNHKYHFQVQGQLHITEKKYCLFSMWTEKGHKTEKIMRDPSFWQQRMEEKLNFFYFECLLPELVDPRFPRSMEIRNPPSILEAQKKKKSQNEYSHIKFSCIYN